MAEGRAQQTKRYRSYLLRLWREGSSDLPRSEPPLWRASLESTDGAARLGFASLLDLFIFLEKETESRTQGLED